MMNIKGTQYCVVTSYDTLSANNHWKMKIFESTQRWGQPATVFDFSWRLVTIHDFSTTNVLIYNLLPTPIAHPLLKEKLLKKKRTDHLLWLADNGSRFTLSQKHKRLTGRADLGKKMK
jgi:hypothetical protein